MACNCSKNRVSASGAKATAGTYRVYVGTRKVYETTNQGAADAVAVKFADARVLAPGVEA